MSQLQQILNQHWYKHSSLLMTLFLWPLSMLFWVISSCRKGCYNLYHHFKHPETLPPVIVVGNITVGGGGKTPLVIETVKLLQQKGFKPAVISRGYGRKNKQLQRVTEDSTIDEVGDESKLIYLKTGVPVIINADRVAALRHIKAHFPQTNIVVSDDGLQHYKMPRAVEIAVYDSKRKYGNEHLLPAGPLREPKSRLNTIDLIVSKGNDAELNYTLRINEFRNITTGEIKPASFFKDKDGFAMAGIADPESFFESLIENKLSFKPIAMPDHHQYTEKDFAMSHSAPIFITEKDAVKCTQFKYDNIWVAISSVSLSEGYGTFLTEVLNRKKVAC